MSKWKQNYLDDLSRYGDSKPSRQIKLFLKYFRKCQFASNRFALAINRCQFSRIKQKLNIELFGKTNIGPGLYIGHPYGITINSDAVIGRNCNIKVIKICKNNKFRIDFIHVVISNTLLLSSNQRLLFNISKRIYRNSQI